VIDGDAVCIRHAIAALDLDDMDEHDEYERLYSDLWDRGYRNVY
jgi:hypothetical protein